MFDDDYEDRDETDELFDELDKVVELAKLHPDQKYYTSVGLIELMADEVHGSDIREYRQVGESWVVEVRYRGITFISVTGKLPFSEIWDGCSDDDDQDDEDE